MEGVELKHGLVYERSKVVVVVLESNSGTREVIALGINFEGEVNYECSLPYDSDIRYASDLSGQRVIAVSGRF